MSDVEMLVLSQVEVYSVVDEVIFNDPLAEYVGYSNYVHVEEIPKLIEYLERVYNEHNAN